MTAARRTSVPLLVLLLVVLQLVGCASMQRSVIASHDATLNGNWQGKLVIDQAADTALEFRLGITNNAASVWIAEKGQWREAKPGAFHLEAHQSNAVIYANDSGSDDDGAWVESWVFVVTLLDNNELLAEWTRVVNNADKLKTDINGKFAVRGAGIMQRMTRP